MAFGVKVIKIKFKNKYTPEEFLEKIKNVNFEAGVPFIRKQGLGTLIVFPPLDRQNEVQIVPQGIGPFDTVVVNKGELATVKDDIITGALNAVTGGFYGALGVVGKNTKEAERLVQATADVLKGLDL